MFTLGSSLRFRLYNKPTDMSKSFDGLCGILQRELDCKPAQFFEGMKAVVQTDGYKAYNIQEKQANKDITLMACMAHARRKFEQARDNDQANAEKALHYFQQLYALEREAREQELSHESRQQLCQEKAEPILEQMHSWLQEVKDGLLPKSMICKAVNYTLELWPRRKKYTEDGRYEIDSNFVENTIRPLALGRKNYLLPDPTKQPSGPPWCTPFLPVAKPTGYTPTPGSKKSSK